MSVSIQPGRQLSGSKVMMQLLVVLQLMHPGSWGAVSGTNQPPNPPSQAGSTGAREDVLLLLDLTPERLQKQRARDGYGSACSGEAPRTGKGRKKRLLDVCTSYYHWVVTEAGVYHPSVRTEVLLAQSHLH
jgi:hypothetical protein